MQNDPNSPWVSENPYHYGTHYSVSGHIIGFLIRLEPLTTMHLEL